jgi:hypothetical protein
MFVNIDIFGRTRTRNNLSSHQFQEQIRRDSQNIEGKETQTVASVVQLLERYENLQRSQQIANQELQKSEQMLNESSAALDSERARSDEFWSLYDATVGKVERELFRLGAELPGGDQGRTDNEVVLLIAQRDFPDNKPLADLVETAGDAGQRWSEAQDKIGRLQQSSQVLTERRAQFESRLKELAQNETDFLGTGKKRDYIIELLAFKDFGFVFLATKPTQLLTLILTLSMGALGSVIYLTRTFFDRQAAAPFSFYLFRPFLGMVTAVAIFVLAKAGQISISDASLSQGISGNLNPFLISFLAVLSGLFSEHAYERIQRAGWAIFRSRDSSESKDRWAYRVQAEIDAQGKDPNELVMFLRVPPEAIADWLDEKQMVPEDAQDIIAAWLGRERRELFSDQAAVEIQSP